MPHLHDANLHPLFRATLDAFCAPVATRNDDLESSHDAAWDQFCSHVETLSGRELNSAEDFDSAYIAHRNGVTASDYALEVVARAGEFL
jgi:hypothetical protein